MKKSEIRRWMEAYLVTQRRLTLGSTIAMATIGVVATVLEFIGAMTILRIGFFGSWWFSGLVAAGILSAVQAVTWLRMPKDLADSEYEVELPGRSAMVRIPPGLPAAWTYGFGSMDTDQSRIELLINLLTVPQRMCCAAWFAWQRYQELETVDPETSARIIRLLHKKAERVNVEELATELELSDTPRAIRELALIDGVVLLTRGSLGLSLANRLTDALADWRSQHATSGSDTGPE